MTRWKLRIAGGLTLLSLLALSPPSTRAGWRTKAEKRPKAQPTDCQFGYYGTGWRAWPEGCRDGSSCMDPSLPYATPFAPPVTSLPPTWSNSGWSVPTPAMPSPAYPTQAPPSPWSTYREYLPSQNPAPQYSLPPNGASPYSLPPQFAPPTLPAPSHVPSFPPIGPATTPPPITPIPEQPPAPPTPQSSRNLVPPLPTTMTPPSTFKGSGVQQAGASTRKGSVSPIVTLGAEFTEPSATHSLPAINRLSPTPSFSSVPKSLIGPKDVQTSRPQRTQNPVTLMSPE